MTDKSEGADTIARAIEIDSSKKGRRSHGRAETLLGDFVKELRLPEDFGRGKISNLSAEDHARVEKETDPNLASDIRIKLIEERCAQLDRTRARENEEKALTFILEVILPVAYYDKKIWRARWERRLWFFLSGMLVVGVPLLLAFLPSLVEYFFPKSSFVEGSHQSSVLVGQITGALTGLIGLQRFITMTLSANQRYAAWWKASSALKTIWYGLLTNWSTRGLETNWPVLRADFLKELDDRTVQGKAAVSDEKANFFQNLGIPQADIFDTMTKARTDAASLITNLLPTATTTLSTQAGDALRARQEIVKNDVLVKKFEDVANKLAEQLANETNPTLKTQIAAALAAAKKERDDAVLAKMKAEATVAALATQ